MYDGYKNDIQSEFISLKEKMRKSGIPYQRRKNRNMQMKLSFVGLVRELNLLLMN